MTDTEDQGVECIGCGNFFAADLMVYEDNETDGEPDAYCDDCWEFYRDKEDDDE